MACTVHEKIKVFDMRHTPLLLSDPCAAAYFAHLACCQVGSMYLASLVFSESHGLERAHHLVQVEPFKGEFVHQTHQLPTSGAPGGGPEEIITPWPVQSMKK
jgi:hypothetical protein